MQRAIAITCQGVSKSFALVDGGSAWRLAFGAARDVPVYHALSDVSFEVPKGQFVGVLGRNGAGKSTLLRVLGGVYAPDRGRVKISGAMSAIYELGLVGNPELTGRAYAERLLTVHGFSPRERADMIADIHDFSELGDRFDDPVLTYSAGMGARLFFATATAGSYEVYLLDEILSVGDQHFQAKCWRRLRDRIARGASGVLVTHDWSAIVRMCETAYVLEGGKPAFGGPAARAVRHYLYGDRGAQQHRAGFARFLDSPRSPIVITSGEDLVLKLRFRVDVASEVFLTFAIERLQPGYGWETALLTRKPEPVGDTPGDYDVEIAVPRLPLAPGAYQIAIHLAMREDGDAGLVTLDGFGWLDGTGVALDVSGDEESGLMLPVRWTVESARADAA